MYPNFKFEVTYNDPDSSARTGLLHTPHGVVETPNFIFCATKASIKGVMPQDMLEANTQIILSNTYHLMLQPGSEVVKKLGGLHKMMGWNGPMFTDSGGYQIFSLGHGSVASEIKGKRNGNRPKTLLKITEEGARFKSYVDGSYHMLTPEKSIQIQRDLGADLIVVLDECTPFHVDKAYTAKSMRMSHRWALRSLEEFKRTDDHSQALYGIIQGGVYTDLRKESSDFVNNHDFFAHAIGGSLGASKDQMHEIVGTAMSMLSKDRPVHLLGIGGISDIFNGAEYGIDTFDCVHPTRLARHGGALVPAELKDRQGDESTTEHLNIRNQKYKMDDRPIDDTCECKVCLNFSRGYIHHLFRAQEMLGMQLLTIHNVFFMNRLLKAVRKAIKSGTLRVERKKWTRL
ncbi:MAG: tRNA guanosine(34) transglycosylase Tgt [Alphaproteobacteria bacterium]|nr:tRNA guanosine(34) transglycosylase Tgt [Alphaproteobacteria bacterium]OJV13213.1 MAG: tRNA guanosine(34) transglycosylase Tgt [Alphaproteobacteria bacterium 33-17]